MTRTPAKRAKTTLLALVASTAASVPLGGCLQGPDLPPSAFRNQVTVAESLERLELYPRADGMTLSARDRSAMAGFLAAYGQGGSGPILIHSPEGAGAGAAAARSEVKMAMASVGLGGAPLRSESYPSRANMPAPVVVSYRRLKTVVPDCSGTMTDLRVTGRNAPSPGWGCAHTANIAAMVADPEQFLGPYPVGAPNAARRMVIYDKYIEGAATGASIPPGQKQSSSAGAGGGGG